MDDPHTGLSAEARRPPDGPPETPPVGAKVVVEADGPATCTLWDADLPEGELTTAWITAEGDAFVSLAEMR